MLGWSPETTFTALCSVVLGFVLLGVGANRLVVGGADLARRLGVQPVIIGLTVVAWGTSIPEALISTVAAIEGRPGSSLGNVLGSNVANIGLVLGCGALILPPILSVQVRLREICWLLGSLCALWLVLYDRTLGRTEAALLLIALGLYTVQLLFDRSASSKADDEHQCSHPVLAVIGGSLALGLGAELVMAGGFHIADRLGMADTVLGLTILALGTSLPELFAGVTSCLRGHPEIGLGNVVGSNIFNTLGATGITGSIRPFELGVDDASAAFGRDFPITLAFSFLLLLLPRILHKRDTRLPGFLLIGAYLAYMLKVCTAS